MRDQTQPPHGVDLLLLIELLELQIVALPVLAVLLLQLLHLSREHGSLNHALFTLQRDGEEHQFNDNGKENQGYAVAAEQIIEKQQQPGKGL